MAQRIVSAWDWDALRYDYYRVPGETSVGGWRPLTGLGVSADRKNDNKVGIDIEDALPPLPAGAVYLGYGPQAIGTIVKPIKRYEYLGMANPTVQQAQQGLSGLGRVIYTAFPGGPRGVAGPPQESGELYNTVVQISETVNTKISQVKAKMGATAYGAMFLGMMIGRRFPSVTSTLSWIVGIAGMVKVVDAARKGKLAAEMPGLQFLTEKAEAEAKKVASQAAAAPVVIQGQGPLPPQDTFQVTVPALSGYMLRRR